MGLNLANNFHNCGNCHKNSADNSYHIIHLLIINSVCHTDITSISTNHRFQDFPLAKQGPKAKKHACL